jgi:hypothetical protein
MFWMSFGGKMRKSLVILLLVLGSTLWATEGSWTYSDDESFQIEYESSTQLWRSFKRYTESCYLIGESQIPIRFGFGNHILQVRMFTQITIFELFDDGFYSWYVLFKR